MHLLRLIKYKLCLAVTFTGAVGYIMFTGELNSGLLIASLGIFILAGGSSALNQYQEKEFDQIMDRTSSRPIPGGHISASNALKIALLFIALGSILLLSLSLKAFLLGLLNIVFYNLLYTRLKRYTYLSILPGALVGALPPLIGWTAAGGILLDRSIIFVAFLIFLWQVPHFWVLLIKYKLDYDKAGYPNILKKMDEAQVQRLVFVWITVSSLFALSYPLFGISLNRTLSIVMVIVNLIFIITFYRLLFGSHTKLRLAFILSNVFITLLFLLYAAGSIVN